MNRLRQLFGRLKDMRIAEHAANIAYIRDGILTGGVRDV